MQTKDTLYIGGEWVAPSTSNVIEVVSPTTEEVIARVPEAAEGDVDRAVAAAKAALTGPYPQLSPAERAEYLRKAIGAALRRELSPRHVPDRVEGVPVIPRTLSGKKLEVPVKKILTGTPPEQAASRDSLADPTSLAPFEALAAARGTRER